MLTARQDDVPCYDRGNSFPFCSPVSTDVWNNGTNHTFVWNYNDPFYVASPSLDLFLYYKERFAYQSIKNWTNMPTMNGQLSTIVDNSWFPTPLTNEPNKTWTFFGFYLPSGMNPYTELTDTNSQYPRPFNFSAVQYASPSNVTTQAPNNSTSSTAADLSAYNRQANQLPGWAIAVITLASVAFVTSLIALAFGWCLHRRRKQRNKLSPTVSHNASTVHDDKGIAGALFAGGAGLSPVASESKRAGGNSPAKSPAILSPSTNVFDQILKDEHPNRLQQQLAEEGASLKQIEGQPRKVKSSTGIQAQTAEGYKPSIASPTSSTTSVPKRSSEY